MFERVISQTIQRLTTEVLRERPMISLAEVLEDQRIPDRLKPFFETEVNWWLYNEMLARQANKRFDYDNPELSSLLSYLEQVQARHARFEREDFLTVLDSAVKLTYNYLCRPQTTLKWYIFRGQPVKPLREVLLRFGAFLDYPYFKTVFADWVQRKQLERPTFDAISSTEFERVIRRIDDQILLNCTVEDLLAIINPIFDFVGEGSRSDVPIDALVIFFDDKNIKRLVEYLEASREAGREMVGREDFVGLLDDLLSSAEEEPEADFSDVYQNDELDDVVRLHIESGSTITATMPPPLTDVTAGDVVAASPLDAAMSFDAPPALIDDLPQQHEEPVAYNEDHVEGEGEFIEDDVDLAIGTIDPEDHRRFTEAFGGTFGDVAIDAAPTIEETPHEPPSIDVDEPSADEPAPEAIAPQSDELAEADMDEDEDEDEDEDDETEGDGPEPMESEVDVIINEYDGDLHPVANGASDDFDAILDEVMSTRPTDQNHEVAREAPDVEEAIGEEAVAVQLDDVRRFITPMLERKVIKRVFDKDREAYDSALDRLNATENWRSASQVLDEIFIQFDVDPYSRTAIRFTDSIYGRYLPKS